MRSLWAFLAAFVLFALCVAGASAQSLLPVTVATCGTPPTVRSPGVSYQATQDVNGNLCTAPNAIMLGGVLKAANFNSGADQAIAIKSPSPNYRINSIVVTNPSVSMTTAVGGFYAATGKAGTPIVAATQVYTGLTTNTPNTSGSSLNAGLAATTLTTSYNANPVYFSLTTGQGVAGATADIYVYIQPLP